MSTIALGTMTFGVETDEPEAHRQLDAFVGAGGTMVDTADVYGGGQSERIVGRWLADNPGVDVVLATKGRFAPPPGSAGASRRSLVRSLEASLDRLGVEAVDLYLVHGWDPVTPVEETLDVLSGFARQGRLHSIGWSNVTGWQLARLMATARLGGFVVPTAIQPQYNLLDRGIEHEVLPCALEEGLAVTPWSPLGGGWLTGKYSRDTRPTGATRLGEDPGRGVEAYDTRNTDRTWRVVDAVEQVADKHDRPMPQVALAWLLTRPGVASVIAGARTLDQLSQALDAGSLELDADDLRLLGEVSAPGVLPYPQGMIAGSCGVDVWDRLGTGG
ncbi:aldo/keto reductase [Nocardioides marmoribigeumensis]